MSAEALIRYLWRRERAVDFWKAFPMYFERGVRDVGAEAAAAEAPTERRGDP